MADQYEEYDEYEPMVTMLVEGGGGGGLGEGETTCHPSCARRRPLRSAEASTGRSRRRSAAGEDVAAAVMGGVEEEEARRSQLQSRCSCAACPGLVATMLGQALTSRSHGVLRSSSTKS